MTAFTGWRSGGAKTALAIMIGSAGFCFGLLQWLQSPALIAGLGFSLFCLIASARLGLRSGRRHLFSPLPLMIGYMGISIGVRGTVNLLTHSSRLEGAIDPTGVLYEETMLRVFLLAFLGVCCLYLGDRLGASGRRKGPVPLPTPSIRPAGGFPLLATGTLLALLGGGSLLSHHGLDLVRHPSAQAVRGMYGLFWTFPLLFAGIYAWGYVIIDSWCRGRRAPAHLYFGLTSMTVAVYALTSSKTALLSAIMLVVAGRHFAVRPPKGLGLTVLAGGGLVLLPLLYLYRNFGITRAYLANLEPRVFLSGFDLLLGRSYLADSLASICLYTPRVFPFEAGQTWLHLFIFWIPRAFWPGKPVSTGMTFGTTFFSSSTQAGQSYYSSSMVGDGFMNLGIAGVCLVMFVAGFALRRYYDYCVGGAPTAAKVFVYSAALPFIAICAEQGLGGFLMLALPYQAVAIVLALFFLVNRPAPAKSLLDHPEKDSAWKKS